MTDFLFYDSKCTLCLREIKLLKQYKDATLKLIDIHSEQRAQHASDFSDKELLSILHLKNADGHWLKGLDATFKAWQHTPYGWLLSPLRWPLINIFADWAYFKWVDRRASRLGYCELAG